MKKIIILLVLCISLCLVSCSNKEDDVVSDSIKEEEIVDKDLLFKEDFDNVLKLITENKLDDAKIELEKLIKVNENNAEYYFTYASIYLKQNNMEKAIENLNKSIEIDSSKIKSYNNLAGVYMVKQEYDKALEIINKGLELNSDYIELKFKKGQILFVKQKYKESIEMLYNVKNDEQYYDAYRFIGLSYINLNENKKAIDNLELYLEKAPEEKPERKAIVEILNSIKK